MSKQVHKKIFYSSIKIPETVQFPKRQLAVMEARSGKEGPVIWLTAAAHGDEIGGIAVIHEVFARLVKTHIRKGRIYGLPLMNPFGFEIAIREIGLRGENLNRCFPGDKKGSFGKRLANSIFTEISRTKPSLVIDLHTGWRYSIPYVLVGSCPANQFVCKLTKKLAFETGLLLIRDSEKAKKGLSAFPNTLSENFLKNEVASFVLELGESFVVNEENIGFGLEAIWNILAHLEMVKPAPTPFIYSLSRQLRGRFCQYREKSVYSKTGIIRFLVKPGDMVKKGELVAKIFNIFGKEIETITAPKRGIIIEHADSFIPHKDEPVIAFGLF